jgi:phosphoribosylanthranilate isomerase
MQKKITLVKNISNLSEARYCAGMMVDFISFQLTSTHPDYVTLDKYFEIKGWLNGLKVLGNGQYFTADEINEQIILRELDGFIFDFSQFDSIHLVECDVKIGYLSLQQFESINTDTVIGLDYIIITGSMEELALKIDLIDSKVPIMLGFDFDNVNLRNKKISGFAFLGTVEFKPGFSSYNRLMDALELLEEI